MRPEDADVCARLIRLHRTLVSSSAPSPTVLRSGCDRTPGNTPLSLREFAKSTGPARVSCQVFLSAGADPNVQCEPQDRETRYCTRLVVRGEPCSNVRNCSTATGGRRRSPAASMLQDARFIDAVTGGYHRLWPLFLQAGAIPNYVEDNEGSRNKARWRSATNICARS